MPLRVADSGAPGVGMGVGVGVGVAERHAAAAFDAAREGAGEGGVVVEGHLVGDVVVAAVLVGEVVGAGGTAHQGAVEGVGIGLAVAEPLPAHPRGRPVVGLPGHIGPEAHQVARLARIGPEDVVHRSLRKTAIGAAGIAHVVGIDIGQERRVGGVAQRTPLADVAQAAGADRHAVAAAHPVVQPALHVLLDAGRAGVLRQDHRRGVGGVVPVACPAAREAADAAGVDGEGLVAVGRAVAPRRAHRPRQPGGAVGQLVVVAAPGVVEGTHLRDRIGVAAPVAVGEAVKGEGAVEQHVSVGGIAVLAEQHRRRGQRRRRARRHIGARLARRHRHRRPGDRLAFGRTPQGVVGPRIAHLGHEVERGAGGVDAVGLEQVVGTPAHRIEQLIGLPRDGIAIGEFDPAPGEGGEGRGQRQPELHVIAGIVVAAREVERQAALQVGRRAPAEVHPVGPVPQAGIAAPVDPLAGLVEVAGALGLIEEEAFLQGLGVIEPHPGQRIDGRHRSEQNTPNGLRRSTCPGRPPSEGGWRRAGG